MRTIDHYVAVVPDQESARGTFARLGFHVRPTATHIEFGSSNAVVIFPHTYLELLHLANAREDLKSQYTGRDHGIAHVSLWADSLADERARLTSLGYEPGPEGNARRKVVLPDGAEDETDSSFLYNWTAPNRYLSIFSSEHRRPEMNYITGFTNHPNGAIDLARVAGVSARPRDDLGYYRDSWDQPPEREDETGFAFRGARGEVMEVRTPAALREVYGDMLDGVPGAAGGGVQVALHYKVKDRAATGDWLDQQGVATVALADGLAVPPQDAEGMILVFE